jgi:hypothetical protein
VVEDVSPGSGKLSLVSGGFVLHNMTGIRIHIVRKLDGTGYNIAKSMTLSVIVLITHRLTLYGQLGHIWSEEAKLYTSTIPQFFVVRRKANLTEKTLPVTLSSKPGSSWTPLATGVKFSLGNSHLLQRS